MPDRRWALLAVLLLVGCQRPAPPSRPPASPAPVLHPSAPSAVTTPTPDALEQGVQALSTGAFADAVVCLRRATDDDPQDPAAHYLLSVALHQLQSGGEDDRRQARQLSGSSVLAAELADPVAKVTVRPPALPTPLRRVAQASPRPSPAVPSPPPVPLGKEPVAATVALPPMSEPPLPPPNVPAPAADGVVVEGTVTRPDAQGDLAPLAGAEVRLMAAGTGAVAESETDADGQFQFDPQEPRLDYYLVVVSPLVVRSTAAPFLQPVPGPHGMAYIPVEQPSEVHRDLSWHQVLDLSTPGAYLVTLDPSNADPEFCADVSPTFDTGSRGAFSSYRIGTPQLESAPSVRH